jgi:hypothetical protein
LSYGINKGLARGTIILMPSIGHVAIQRNPTTTNDDDVDELNVLTDATTDAQITVKSQQRSHLVHQRSKLRLQYEQDMRVY